MFVKSPRLLFAVDDCDALRFWFLSHENNQYFFQEDAHRLGTFTHGVKVRIYSSHTLGLVGAQELQRVM